MRYRLAEQLVSAGDKKGAVRQLNVASDLRPSGPWSKRSAEYLKTLRVASRERAEPIGAYLARQRVLRGITLEELAESTRIPIRSLARLEAGVFDAEPDGFARGFVRTVAAGARSAAGRDRRAHAARAQRGRPAARSSRVWLQRGLAAAGIAFADSTRDLDRHRPPAPAPPAGPATRDELVHRHDAIRAFAERAEPEGPTANGRAATQRPLRASLGAWPRSRPRRSCCAPSTSASPIASHIS